MSGVGAKIAGQILGPRPGLAIVSFMQGRVEILLRILAPLIGSLPALITAAVALAKLLEEKETISDLEKNGNPNADRITDLRDNTYATTGFIIALAAVAIIYEIVMIALRFINIGLINLKIKIFLITDFIVSLVLAAGHVVGGVLAAFYAAEWDDENLNDNLEHVQRSLIASAVFCFIGSLLFTLVAIFMLLFMIKDWNSEVVKATIKEAITS